MKYTKGASIRMDRKSAKKKWKCCT